MRLDVVYNKLIEDSAYQDIAFIKVDANNRKNAEFATHYQIRYVPTLFTYNASGENVWNTIGAIDEAKFREILDEIKP